VFEKGPFLPGAIGEMVEPILPAVVQSLDRAGDLLDNTVREASAVLLYA
jgi:hypothetical protein